MNRDMIEKLKHPEYEDCEIDQRYGKGLYYHSPDGWRTLWHACCGEYPKFVGYFYMDNKWKQTTLEGVHTKYREKYDCIVRFLK